MRSLTIKRGRGAKRLNGGIFLSNLATRWLLDKIVPSQDWVPKWYQFLWQYT